LSRDHRQLGFGISFSWATFDGNAEEAAKFYASLFPKNLPKAAIEPVKNLS
jgi:predicted 3-demethylubiquinone-9 3-methyltransferase (glyoxalase superfamily)